MAQTAQRISDVLDLSGGFLPDRNLIDGEAATTLADEVEKKGPLTWKIIERQLGKVLTKALDINLEECFLEAWKKLDELHDHRDSDSQVRDIDIAEHEVAYELEQRIDVLLKTVPVGEINVKLSLIGQFDAIRLGVGKGRIWSANPGVFSLSGTIVVNGNEIANQQSRDYEFPGELTFKKGIPIP